MNLDLDVQLQVALRALEDTVAPALGGAWAEAQSAKIEAWSYAELLEAVIDAGT